LCFANNNKKILKTIIFFDNFIVVILKQKTPNDNEISRDQVINVTTVLEGELQKLELFFRFAEEQTKISIRKDGARMCSKNRSPIVTKIPNFEFFSQK